MHQEDPRPWRHGVLAVAALLLVLVALLVPNEISAIGPGAFVRIPVEGLLGVALLLVLPVRWARVAATAAGLLLGLLVILKAFDMGFSTVLARPFDPVVDWGLVGSGLDFLQGQSGTIGVVAAVAAAALAAAAVLVLLVAAVRCLARVVVRRRVASTRALAVLVPLWIVCSLLGVQVVPGVPVASESATALAYDRAVQVGVGLADQQSFAEQVDVDAFRTTAPEELLTALRGKDVVLAFVESYGRSAVEDPEMGPLVGAVLDDGTRKLAAAGFGARSAFLTSPTAGGGSWLAHATFLSGVWVDNQQRYRTLVDSKRTTLTSAFRRADWRTVALMPGTTGDWPEAEFYGHDTVYDARTLGYHGPELGWATTPDQFTLAALQRLERGKPGHPPLMAELAFVTSHAPWPLVPPLLSWDEIGDGTVYNAAADGPRDDAIFAKGADHVRTQYRRSIEYSLQSLVSYVETFGDDNLVLVLLGDHQPAPVITGDGAGRDVPITIVTRDRSVLQRVDGWGWQDGMRPAPDAPVWRMDAFRDRFLTTFAR